MADYTTDLYPIPVEFQDGQQPTAAFFNAWAAQIDEAFILLSRILGDYDGNSEAVDTYVSNIIRSLGSLGHINNRLPANLRITSPNGPGDNKDLPMVTEKIGSLFEGKKEALLSFTPWATQAGANTLGLGINHENLGTPVNRGVTVKTSTLDAAGKWILDGRRVLTSTAIPANATITYAIQTESDGYKDSYGSGTGPNVIPSLYELSAGLSLCTVTDGDNAQEYIFSFPNVRKIQNPNKPFATAAADMIQFDDAGSTVAWAIETPKWRVPQYIYALATAPGQNNIIPAGLVSIWYDNGSTISRVRTTGSSDITFEVIAGNYNAVKVTLPAGFSLPTDGDPGEDNDDRYIVAFAGTSIAEALLHERSRMLSHKHDGQGDDSAVSAEHLKDRFNPAHWTHSITAYNHLPQYLSREGYTAGDVLNGRNSMLGNLVIGSSAATPSSPQGVLSLDDPSYVIYFGDVSSGPALFWNSLDVSGYDDTGKFNIYNTAVRVLDKFYLGSAAFPQWLDAIIHDTDDEDYRYVMGMYPDVGDDDIPNAVESWWSAYTLRARSGEVRLGDTTADTDGSDDILLRRTGDGTATLVTSSGGGVTLSVDGLRSNSLIPISGGNVYVYVNPKTEIDWHHGTATNIGSFDEDDDPDYAMTVIQGVSLSGANAGEFMIRTDSLYSLSQAFDSDVEVSLINIELQTYDLSFPTNVDYMVRVREVNLSNGWNTSHWLTVDTLVSDADRKSIIVGVASGEDPLVLDLSKVYYVQIFLSGYAPNEFLLQNIKITTTISES